MVSFGHQTTWLRLNSLAAMWDPFCINWFRVKLIYLTMDLQKGIVSQYIGQYDGQVDWQQHQLI
jgi:hypothetical protein